MASVTHGRDVPDNDPERIAFELREFEKKAATRFQKELAKYILNRYTGNLRLCVKVRDGRLVGVQFNNDDEIRLDADGKE